MIRVRQGAVGLLAAVAVGVPAGLALGNDETAAGGVPAGQCPAQAAVLVAAGIEVDGFAAGCPPLAEVAQHVADREALNARHDALRADAVARLERALAKARSGQLAADVEPKSARDVLELLITRVKEGSVDASLLGAEFEDEANELLDQLRASGDLPRRGE